MQPLLSVSHITAHSLDIGGLRGLSVNRLGMRNPKAKKLESVPSIVQLGEPNRFLFLVKLREPNKRHHPEGGCCRDKPSGCGVLKSLASRQ